MSVFLLLENKTIVSTWVVFGKISCVGGLKKFSSIFLGHFEVINYKMLHYHKIILLIDDFA